MRNKGTCIKHGELKTLAQNTENKRHTSHWELKRLLHGQWNRGTGIASSSIEVVACTSQAL